MGRASSVRGASCLYQPDVFWLRRRGAERIIRPLACVPGLRNQPAPRPQRREEYRKARAEPSGRGGVGRPGEPRIPCRGECQHLKVDFAELTLLCAWATLLLKS